MKPPSLAHVLQLQAQTHAQPNNQSTSVSDPLLQQLLLTIADCCSQISDVVHNGALGGILGSAESENVQGETQKQLDIIANDLLVAALSKHPAVAGLASEEMDDCINTSDGQTKPYLVLFDPLDGSSNIDVNVSIGTIFSILPAPKTNNPTTDITNASFLQHGRAQVAAGYVVYGPQTTLVLTLGNGVMSFTLDRSTGLFYQAHERMVVPKATREFAINMSNQRHWYAPVQRYIAELLAGKTGPREKDFNMRWVASMVADVHRVLSRGGIFMYPKDQRDPNKPGKLRLMYEANPMSFLVEQAGGLAFDHTTNILDITPTELHQRCSVALGSSEEVARLVSICQE